MKKKVIGAMLMAVSMLVVACGSAGTTGTNSGADSAEAAPASDKAAAGGDYTIKMSTQLSEGSPFVDGFYAWADAVKEKTDGHVTIEVYPSAALGSDEDVIEQALQGANVAVLTDCGRMGNYVKEMGILNAAYFADNYEEMQKFMETDTFKGWTDELESQHGIKILNFGWCDGFRHFLTNKPIYSPDDLKGVLIRTPGADVWSKSIESLGATPVSTVGWADVYNAVQTKTIDGAEGQTSASYPAALYEVLDYMDQTGHILLMNGIIVGEKYWETIPEEYQKIIIDECAVAAQNASKVVQDQAADNEAKMAEAGMTIIPPEEIDIEAFRKASEKAYEELGFTELRAELYEKIGKK
ncbi:C4-dicarboxylate TRAP transporter substrate-binding protein [Butyrivibrio sp. INlla21]|uniref:C4-dicarboxylate TRAP transporter substrate-binding protein n=1 Tax=Butyrivibrio sp. INlla21 TaxID=1520811 RepID=UPI0008F02B5F|nr:C4-dicarboxylate TRAP transporter substrate-binding protein [Butyrivibrio sp. INlla21]SFU83157.1 TRAP-type C4-dicarboxylate transport system, substrate-binding protein [Butyrivibrio sp. INlla21]